MKCQISLLITQAHATFYWAPLSFPYLPGTPSKNARARLLIYCLLECLFDICQSRYRLLVERKQCTPFFPSQTTQQIRLQSFPCITYCIEAAHKWDGSGSMHRICGSTLESYRQTTRRFPNKMLFLG